MLNGVSLIQDIFPPQTSIAIYNVDLRPSSETDLLERRYGIELALLYAYLKNRRRLTSLWKYNQPWNGKRLSQTENLERAEQKGKELGKLWKFKKQSGDEEVGLQSLVAGICREADGVY